MSRSKIFAAVAIALLCLGTSPANAQELGLQGRPIGFSSRINFGLVGGSGYDIGPLANVELGYNTAHTRSKLLLGGSNASKKQTDGSSYNITGRSQYDFSKSGSVGVGLLYGCFVGEAFDSCALRAEMFVCLRTWTQEFCGGGVASLIDDHDLGGLSFSWEYEFRRSHYIKLNLTSARSRIQGVAGMPGFDGVTGMSDEFVGTGNYAALYGKSW